MSSFLTALFSLSVSGSLMALLLFAGRPLLKNRVSKAFSYYVWLLVLLRLVLPVSVPGSAMDALFSSRQAGTVQAASPAESRTAASRAVIAQASGNRQAAPQKTRPENTPAPQSSGKPGQPASVWKFVASNAGWIWLAGSLVSFSWFAGAYFAFSRRMRRSCVEPYPDDFAVFRRLCRDRGVRLACSGRVGTPLLLGLVHPVIVLPRAAYVHCGMESELRDVLRHELTHYRRKDVCYKWFVVAVTSLHWFNPLMLPLRREIGRACELSCDEAVISGMSSEEKRKYGNTLLTFSAGGKLPAATLATTLSEGKRDLKERLIGIMKYKKKTAATAALALTLTLLLAGCGTVLGSAGFGSGAGQSKTGGEGSDSSSAGSPSAVTAASVSSADQSGYGPVLRSEVPFTNAEDGKEIFLKDDLGNGSNAFQTSRLALFDLDGDKAPEAVLELSRDGSPEQYVVFHKSGGKVIGYSVPYRGLEMLKADGTFQYANSSADTGVEKITAFGQNSMKTETLGNTKQGSGSNEAGLDYFLAGESVTKAAYSTFLNRQNAKNDAPWQNLSQETRKTQPAADDNTGSPSAAESRAPLAEKKSYFGSWVVRKVLAYGPSGTYGSADAGRLVGDLLGISAEKAAVITDDPSNSVVSLAKPGYQESTVSGDGFLSEYRISFEKLGIAGDSAKQVEVSGPDGESGVFLVKNADTLVFIAGGTCFELDRQ